PLLLRPELSFRDVDTTPTIFWFHSGCSRTRLRYLFASSGLPTSNTLQTVEDLWNRQRFLIIKTTTNFSVIELRKPNNIRRARSGRLIPRKPRKMNIVFAINTAASA